MPHNTYPSEFRKACRDVLEYLNRKYPMSLWMMTRRNGEDWVVLDAEDHFYNVKSLETFKWSDSFCSRMIEGLGPNIAPKSDEIAAYAEAPIGRQVKIQAYIGLPLEEPDGNLFGTLCAIAPNEKTSSLNDGLEEFQLISKLLMHIYKSEEQSVAAKHLALKLNSTKWIDPESGAMNEQSWLIDAGFADTASVRYGDCNGLVYFELENNFSTVVTTLSAYLAKHGTLYRVSQFGFAAIICNRTPDFQQGIAEGIEYNLNQSGFQVPVLYRQVGYGKHCSNVLRDLTTEYQEIESRKAS